MSVSMPLGEPAVAPPFSPVYSSEFDRSLGAASPYPSWGAILDKDDRRQGLRRTLRCRMALVENPHAGDDGATVPGECLNIGHGGLYGTVALGYGVAMGQRYTFRLHIPERGPEPGAIQTVTQQGLIVRTELLMGESGENDRIGIAVRFTGHRTGLVPMPASL